MPNNDTLDMDAADRALADAADRRPVNVAIAHGWSEQHGMVCILHARDGRLIADFQKKHSLGHCLFTDYRFTRRGDDLHSSPGCDVLPTSEWVTPTGAWHVPW